MSHNVEIVQISDDEFVYRCKLCGMNEIDFDRNGRNRNECEGTNKARRTKE